MSSTAVNHKWKALLSAFMFRPDFQISLPILSGIHVFIEERHTMTFYKKAHLQGVKRINVKKHVNALDLRHLVAFQKTSFMFFQNRPPNSAVISEFSKVLHGLWVHQVVCVKKEQPICCTVFNCMISGSRPPHFAFSIIYGFNPDLFERTFRCQQRDLD